MTELLGKLQIYEGPLDLLLHLIKKNEVELDDIPVALSTAQYLEYLELMEALNIEVAADFLVMAATLIKIKSRLLLPREEGDGLEGDADEALKADIIDPLLDLMNQGPDEYRGAVEILRGRHQLGQDVFIRGRHLIDEEPDSGGDGPLAAASLFDLVEAFRRLTSQRPATPTLNFVVESKTLSERLGEMQSLLKARGKVTFGEMCAGDRDKMELVLSFLGVLELARVGFLKLWQNLADSPEIHLFLANPEAEVSGLEELDY